MWNEVKTGDDEKECAVVGCGIPLLLRGGLLFCGFWVAPVGEIHNSVLVAYGEISTFAGSLLGFEYVRNTAFKRGLNDIEKKLKDKEEKKNE